MVDEKNWQLDLDGYIRQGEPGKAEKSEAWKTAIGLQAVDGLKTSDYLLKTAVEHIEGKIDIKVAQERIEGYYEERSDRHEIEADTKEADIVSSRIAELLGEAAFQFSPAEWMTIHRRLFKGIFDHAGQIRTYNITKKEWVLKGKTVIYASFESIMDTLNYDFNMEKQFSYDQLSIAEAVKHISKFAADIWQIHPFGEGNTRSTAVFIIKYLKTFGLEVRNTAFAENSWYFRNALVRANYNDLRNGIYATTRFLELFFENLIMEQRNELKNRYLHIDYPGKQEEERCQNGTHNIMRCQNGTSAFSIEELAMIKIIVEFPAITQKGLAERLGKSERTIKRKTMSLQEKGYIRRANGSRNGNWEVLVDI